MCVSLVQSEGREARLGPQARRSRRTLLAQGEVNGLILAPFYQALRLSLSVFSVMNTKGIAEGKNVQAQTCCSMYATMTSFQWLNDEGHIDQYFTKIISFSATDGIMVTLRFDH